MSPYRKRLATYHQGRATTRERDIALLRVRCGVRGACVGAVRICVERDVILDASDYKSRAYGRLTNAGS